MPYEVPTDFRNILLVWGERAATRAGLNRLALLDYLNRNPEGCPVGNHTHDFWIANTPSSSDSDYDGPGVNFDDPRPFRGIIQMGNSLIGMNRNRVSSYLWVWLQELAHYWLVPGGLRAAGQTFTESITFFRALYDGTEFPWSAMLARNGGHWSSYLNDMSPMDGVLWREEEAISVEGTQPVRRYVAETAPVGVNVTYPGEATPVPGPRFSDLDLTIMGVIPREQAYAQRSNEFEVITPIYVTATNFHAGMMLVFAPDDIVYFGFREHFRTISIERTGGAFSTSVSLPASLDPFLFDRRMIFRIVRRGNDYHFQVRPELGSLGCLALILEPILASLRIPDPFPRPIDPFSDLNNLPPQANPNPNTWNTWNTPAILTEQRAPIAVGYSIKTWDDVPPSVVARFTPMQIQEGGTPRTISTIGAPVSGSYTGSLTTTGFTFHQPVRGPRIRRLGDQIVLTASDVFLNDEGTAITGIGALNHWTGVDSAPKLLTAAPSADFVAVGAGRLDRVVLSPWAAGAMTGRTLWGYRRRFSTRDFELPAADEPKRRNPMGAYKTAFMIVTERRDQITDEMIRNADQLRMACQTLLSGATGGRRSIDTTL